MKKYLVLLALFVPLLVFGANTPQVTNITNSSRLYRMGINLTAGTSYVFRTYGVTSVDTVLYLLNSSNSQVAYNDDCGANCVSPQTSLNSTMSFTPTTTGYYYVVMRNYYSETLGVVANLKVFTNGTPGSMMTDLPLGGIRTSIQPWDAYYQSTPIVAWRKLYYYYFNRDKEAAGGASANDTVMYLMSNNSITNYDDDSGAGATSQITKTSGSCSSGCYVLSGSYPTSSNSEGKARLIVDVNTRIGGDFDLDGLSDALETILGTSSAMLGGGDTDQDGIGDLLETVGSGIMTLPWEGSDPLVKDIFIEADYMPTPSNLSPRNYVNYLPAAIDYFSNFDDEDFLENIKYSFMHHGNTRIHFEIDDQIPYYQYMGCRSNEHPEILASDLKSSYFTAAREGVYRYAVFGDHVDDPLNGEDDGRKGLSCQNSSTFLIGAQDADDDHNTFITLFIHELGHQLNLDHNGSEDPVGTHNCGHKNSTVFRSIMNYGFANDRKVPRNKILMETLNGLIPVDNPADSEWRYATDDPETTQYNIYFSCHEGIHFNIDWDAGEEDYQGCVSNYQYSSKQGCLDNPSSTCDCTWNEYENSLDFYSGGLELSMILGSGLEEEDQLPVIGVSGAIIAENPEKMKEMGINYGKFKELEVKSLVENKKRMEEKYYTDSVVEQYNKKLIEKLRKNRTMKEGKDFEFKNGKVIFNTTTGYRSFNDE